jgi:hypothetical protein
MNRDIDLAMEFVKEMAELRQSYFNCKGEVVVREIENIMRDCIERSKRSWIWSRKEVVDHARTE